MLVVQTLTRAGYILNIKKSDLLPTQDLVVMNASMEGWGGFLSKPNSDLEALFSDDWTRPERHLHINILELRAIRLTLQLVTYLVAGRVVHVECDNTTAIAHLNHQGGTNSASLNDETALLYRWAVMNQVTLSAIHRLGVDNVLADYLSRNRPDPLEWSLSHCVCDRLIDMWGRSQIDLFASPQNYKLDVWFCWHANPAAAAADAFAQSWTGWYVYAFPPKNLIMNTLTKLRSDQVMEAIVVVPNWP